MDYGINYALITAVHVCSELVQALHVLQVTPSLDLVVVGQNIGNFYQNVGPNWCC